METATAFILNNAIASWRDEVSRSPNLRPEDVAELEGHLRDSLEGLQARGLSQEEAFLVATRRLGHPAGLESEFAKINRREVWLNRLLWMLIGVQVWGAVSTASRCLGNAAVIVSLTGFGYHVRSSNMPPSVWSALSGLTAALTLLAQLLGMGVLLAGCCYLARWTEDGAHRLVNRILQRPFLAGFAVLAFLLVINGTWIVERMLVQRCVPPSEAISFVYPQMLVGLVLWPLQIAAFVTLTIALLRRRLRPQQAA